MTVWRASVKQDQAIVAALAEIDAMRDDILDTLSSVVRVPSITPAEEDHLT